MIATIKKLDGTYLDHSKFESEEQAMVWFQPKIDQGIYGEFVIEFSEEVVSQDEINSEALNFLSETDWYVTRLVETGVDIPLQIKYQRQAARDRVVR